MSVKVPNYAQALLRLEILTNRQVQCSVEVSPFNLNSQDISSIVLDWNIKSYYSEIDEFLTLGMKTAKEKELIIRQAEIGRLIMRLALPGQVLETIKKTQSVWLKRIVIVVITKQIELDLIPWELMSLPEILPEFGLQPLITVVRSIEVDRKRAKDFSDNAHHFPSLMVVSSSPLQENSPNPGDEFKAIEDCINSLKIKPQYHRFDNVEYNDFLSGLRGKVPTILHLALHSDHTLLQFKRNEGLEQVSYSRFVDAITDNTKIRAAIFNVCYSAETQVDSSQKSLVKQLAERGIQAVIGMGSQITPLASLIFSETFYKESSMGASLVEAFAKAIDALREYSSPDKLLWSVPMLYELNDLDLFDILDLPVEWPVEYIQDLLLLINGFCDAMQEVSSKLITSPEQMELETIPLRFILPSLIDHLDGLSENMPWSARSDVLTRVLKIKDKQGEIQNNMYPFQTTLAELLAPTKSDLLKNDRVRYFLTLGNSLVEKLSDLHILLS